MHHNEAKKTIHMYPKEIICWEYANLKQQAK